MYLRIGTLLACFLIAPVWAQGVIVSGAWVRGTVAGQMATGAFMELKAGEDATLLGASSPVAGVVEVHEMTMDNGVMKMRALPRLSLPVGKAVALRPGSYHIMLMDLKQPLKKGDSVPLTLRVEGKDKKVSTLEVKAEVRDLTAMPAMEHQH
ncbi:MAG: copper chaperone PCu(A)C [Proteobacteria bacterium]|nr:copper chaperone PCu(A)C [Pseudomonadota bacterium]